jgi:hypothetical protein
MRNFWIPLSVLGAVSVFASCTGSDPAAIEFKDRVPLSSSGAISTSGGSGSNGGSNGGSSGDGGTSGGPTGDGGSSGSLDPNIDPANPNYVGNAPTANKHRMGGAAGLNALTNANNCTMGGNCHGGTAPKFLTGGVVFQTKGNAANRAANAEVWINSAGKRFKVNTDTDGAFWVVPNVAGAPATLDAAAKTTIRTAAKVVPMSGNAGGAGCNGGACHGGATQGGIYVDQ